MQPEASRFTGIPHLVKRLDFTLFPLFSPDIFCENRQLILKTPVTINANNRKTFDFTPKSH